ncbi:hypothetical protein D3C84_998160 [compost metagenome]
MLQLERIQIICPGLSEEFSLCLCGQLSCFRKCAICPKAIHAPHSQSLQQLFDKSWGRLLWTYGMRRIEDAVFEH